MPELPEVEVVRGGLEKILQDRPLLTKIELRRKNLRTEIPIKKLQKLEGLAIERIERRAKYLLLWTAQGGILSHLGMTGTWRVAPTGDERDHDHIYLHFAGGLRLAYRDPRRFGCFEFIDLKFGNSKLANLGPEPLTKEFTGDLLWQSLRSKVVPIKVAIMDQKIVVGVGNIYASEALFLAGVRPKIPAKSLSRKRAQDLVLQIKTVLQKAIVAGGSSISDFAQTSGESGYFQNNFAVYGRDRLPCVVCGTQVRSEIMGGRNTFWCSGCQK